MKYIVEFGQKGAYHSSETITIHSNKEAAKLAASLVLVLTQDNSISRSVQATWYLSKYEARTYWENDTHFVALSKLDGVERGSATSVLWRKNHDTK